MKWYNKDKTRMYDIDAITSFEFHEIGGKYDLDTLEFVCGGVPKAVQGDEAEELYKILTSTKEVL